MVFNADMLDDTIGLIGMGSALNLFVMSIL